MQPRLADALAAFQQGDLQRARELTEVQLRGDPGSPQVQHLMGLIECRSGRLDSGIEWLRRASAGEPDNVAYRVMLARALIDSGLPQEALDVASPPAGTTPAEFALWHARAEAADAVCEWPAAAEAWNRVCAARPGDWLAWSNLGNALGETGRWAEAAVALKRAVALNPVNPTLRRSLGAALTNSGRLDEGVEEFRRCIEAAPDDRWLRISLARILADLGREDEAAIELDKAAELAGGAALGDGHPDLLRLVVRDEGQVDLLALRELAELLERTSRMDAVDRLIGDAERLGVGPEQIGYPAAAAALRQGDAQQAKRLLLTENPDVTPLRWHWLMARIEDALGNSQAAFSEAETMHRLAPNYDEWRRRGAEQVETTRRYAEAITPSWAAALRTLEPGERESPVFVVGFPRSGTTLLDTFLMGHPATNVLEEIPLVRAAETAIGDWTALPQRSTAELERARDAYFAELDRHVAPADPPRVVDKLPLNMLAAPVIHTLFPDARLIFAQRHPCDVVLSCFMQAFVLNDPMACFLDVHTAAEFYDSAMNLWTRACEVLQLNVHTVVYEDLVAGPEAALRPAIGFLGLDWRDELLDHRATAQARGHISTPSYNQVTQPLTTASSGRWRRYEQQLDPVLPILLPWAERLGYRD